MMSLILIHRTGACQHAAKILSFEIDTLNEKRKWAKNRRQYYIQRYRRMLREKLFSNRGFGELDKDFVFLHIPKAGGSSLRRFFSDLFGQSSVFPEPKLKTGELSSFLNRGRPSVYMSHIDYVQLSDTPMYKATMLRHPVERLLSVYSYSINSGKQPPLIGGIDPKMSLLEFLGSERPGIRMNIKNSQTWQLGYGYHTKERKAYRAQGGTDILRTAKSNLESIDFVGVLEQSDQFREKILSAFGVPGDQTPPVINRSVARLKYSDLSAPEKKAVETCVRKDVELYDFACKLL